MSKKRLKQVIPYLFAIVAVCSYLLQRDKEIDLTVSSNAQYGVEIVLLDKDKDCVPFTVYTEKETIEEQVKVAYELMKNRQSVKPDFYGLFSNNSEINSVVIEDKVMSIDFNSSFLEIDIAYELKALEALSYVFNQFDELEGVIITVDGNQFDGFTHGRISVTMPMKKTIALNNFDTMNSMLHKTDNILLAMSKTIDEVQYYTLKTIRTNQSKIDCLIQIYKQQDSILFDGIKSFKKFDILIEDEILKLTISDEVLTDDKQLDMNKMKTILLTLKSNFEVERVQIFIDNVLIKEIELKELNFNQI